ncbi:hypothetical protein F-VV10_0269 [Faustovirus]|nr:hypothetical protein F-VV10_0269 [Faustovirus]
MSFDYSRAFDAYNENDSDLTSTFSFTQCDDLVVLKITNRDRRRLVADAVMFTDAYYNDNNFAVMHIHFDNEMNYYSFEMTLSD